MATGLAGYALAIKQALSGDLRGALATYRAIGDEAAYGFCCLGCPFGFQGVYPGCLFLGQVIQSLDCSQGHAVGVQGVDVRLTLAA